MRRIAPSLPVAILAFAGVLSGVYAADGPQFVVIANKQNRLDKLTVAKLRIIFLRKISRWPWGAETDPVDLPDESGLRGIFTREVLEKSLAELGVYWIDQRATRN